MSRTGQENGAKIDQTVSEVRSQAQRDRQATGAVGQDRSTNRKSAGCGNETARTTAIDWENASGRAANAGDIVENDAIGRWRKTGTRPCSGLCPLGLTPTTAKGLPLRQ